MEVHANAPLSPIGRRRVVDRVLLEGWSVAAAAASFEEGLVALVKLEANEYVFVAATHDAGASQTVTPVAVSLSWVGPAS